VTNSAPAAPASKKKKTSALEAFLEQKSRPIRYEQLEKEKLAGSRWRYMLKIDAADESELLDAVVAEFAKVVQMPGFRPGKAPAKMVRTRFEGAAREEMIKRVVPRLVEQLAEADSHEVLGTPVLLTQKSNAKDGTVVELAFEVKPVLTVTEGVLDGLETEATRNIVDETVVDWGLEQLRIRHATYQAGDDSTAWNYGDAMVFDCRVEDQDGDFVEELSSTDTYATDVERRFPATIVEMLQGKKKGDQVIGTHVLRQNAQVEVPGVEELVLKYIVTVKEVKPRVLPELTDAFVKDVNPELNTVAELREHQRAEAEKSFDEESRKEALGKLYEELRKRLDFEVPRALVQNTMRRQVADVERRLNTHNLSLNQTDASFQSAFLNRVQANAEQTVRDFFISEALAKFFKVEVTEDQINEELEKLAKSAGRKPMAIRASLEKNRQWDQFIEDLRHRAVNGMVLAKAKVTYRETKLKRNEKGALVPAE
jgi:trigger factor